MAPSSISRRQSTPPLKQKIEALQAELERNRRVLEVLYNISLACHGITSFRDIFEAICRELRLAFSFDACYISLFDNRHPDQFRASLMIDEGVSEYQEYMSIGVLTGMVL